MSLSQCSGASAIEDEPLGSVAVDSRSESGDAIGPINAFRAQHGLSPLRNSRVLDDVVATYAGDMERNGFIGHSGSDGASLRDRVRAQNYRACWFGEVLGFGQTSANEIVTSWITSPSHRNILLKRRAVEYGLARGPANAWVFVVAEPGCR